MFDIDGANSAGGTLHNHLSEMFLSNNQHNVMVDQ